MKSKCTIFTVMILTLLLASVLVQAQPGPGRGGLMLPDSAGIAKMADDLDEAVGFTADQKTKVKKLLVAHFEEVKKQVTHSSGKRGEMRAARMELRGKLEEDIKKILNDEQKKKYEKYISERRKSFGRRGRRP